MTHIYRVREGGSSEILPFVPSTDEDRDLQALLEKNHDLLPGDQIDPDEPRRWLLVKREMPVPDPSTGTDRWSIDFFFTDQDATPTFVECKRFHDTRSRREVVGQMLEYAANGHHYWTKDQIRDFAEAAARNRGLDLEEAMQHLAPSDTATTDAFFERVQENLRQGQLRIVFFLDQAPMELRSVVDFLNRQMERSEVLLVEARQFSDGDGRVVVPTLFGYTDQARMAKRRVTVTRPGDRGQWDEESFFIDATSKLSEADVAAVRGLLEGVHALGCEVTWGTGRITGSYNVKHSVLSERSLYTVKTSGELSLNFVWLNRSQREERVRERFKELLVDRARFQVPDTYRQRNIAVPQRDWVPNIQALLKVLEVLINEFEGSAA